MERATAWRVAQAEEGSRVMAPAFEQVPLHAHTHAHTNIPLRAELRGPCWSHAQAVLGSVQLAPHVGSLRLRSRGHAPHTCAHK